MAAKWWRYNSTSHIFEQSLDEGVSWGQPPLHAMIITEGVFAPERLGGNLAYTDASNTFTNPVQIFQASVGYIELRLVDLAAAVDNRTIRLLNYEGKFQLWLATDGLGPAGVFYFNRDGSFANNGVICPGRVDIAGSQATWYLGSHGSYGLYTNTGLYAAAAIQCGVEIRASGGFYDYNRAIPVGGWQVYGVGAGNFWADATSLTFNGTDYVYMLVGNTCFINFVVYLTLAGPTTYIYCHIPVTVPRQMTGFGMTESVQGPITFIAKAIAGANYLQLVRTNRYPYGDTTFPAGAHAFYLQMFMQF